MSDYWSEIVVEDSVLERQREEDELVDWQREIERDREITLELPEQPDRKA